MGITIGDVLTVVATVVGTAVSAWALTICAALLFTRRTDAAHAALRQSWAKCLTVGLLATFALLFVSTALASLALPVMKLLGLFGYTTTLALAAVGSAGFARLVANRIMRHDPEVSAYSALTRGAGLLVAAAAFPVLGFFVITPLLIVLSVGAGTIALVARAQTEATAAEMRGA
jgi:hypothetical protein